jgi:monoamine oxidase
MVGTARDASGGRLLTVLGGGSRTDLATMIIPQVIRRLGAE